jgi:hypothetical protein
MVHPVGSYLPFVECVLWEEEAVGGGKMVSSRRTEEGGGGEGGRLLISEREKIYGFYKAHALKKTCILVVESSIEQGTSGSNPG